MPPFQLLGHVTRQHFVQQGVWKLKTLGLSNKYNSWDTIESRARVFKPSLETCFLLLFRQLIRSLVDEGFQIIRVFLHHGHHVVEYVWLPEKKKKKKKIHLSFLSFRFIREYILFDILSICIDSLLYTNSIYFKNGFSLFEYEFHKK